MIQNPKILAEFEKDLIRKTKPDYRKNLAIFEAMYKEYLALRRSKIAAPLEGLGLKIKIARVINSV